MPEGRLLLDTSAWILYLRPGCPLALMNVMRGALPAKQIVSLPLVLLELLSGSRSYSDYESLRDDLAALPLLDMDAAMWEIGYRLGYVLRLRGFTVPSTDVLIAAAAIRHGATLLHYDRHFNLIARHSQLKALTVR